MSIPRCNNLFGGSPNLPEDGLEKLRNKYLAFLKGFEESM